MTKEIKFKGVLYGMMDKGTILDGLCAPSEQLDFIGGTFQHTGDAYYNCWPSGGTNKWKQVKSGVHTTKDIALIEALLNKDQTACMVTKRCVEYLNSLGYVVSLKQFKRFSYEVRQEFETTFDYRYPSAIMRLIDTKVTVNGKIVPE